METPEVQDPEFQRYLETFQDDKDEDEVNIQHLKNTQCCDGLSFHEKVLASDKITHSVVTPIDNGEYIQVM